MKTLKQTSQFKKDLKKIQNQPKKISALETVLKLLSQTGTLPKEYRPHWLTGDYKGYMECHIESDFLLIWIDENADLIKLVSDPINVIPDPIKNMPVDPITERLYQAIRENNRLNYAEYGALLGVSEATIKRRLGALRKAGMIIRVGSNKTGHWEMTDLGIRKEEGV